MPVNKSADRYRGKMRLRDRRIKELTRPKTTVVAGVWPDDPVTALAEWCADTLVVPPGHPLAGQPMALPWYIADFLREALAPGIFESLLSTARKNTKTGGIAMLMLGLLAAAALLAKLALRIGCALDSARCNAGVGGRRSFGRPR